ncbi:MAG: hypothetical protein ACOYN0_03225, partial [Phycisphaerales bacterium]
MIHPTTGIPGTVFYSQLANWRNGINGASVQVNTTGRRNAGGNNWIPDNDPVQTRGTAANGAPDPSPVNENWRHFSNVDFNHITRGTYHCVPASAAMILQYHARRLNIPIGEAQAPPPFGQNNFVDAADRVSAFVNQVAYQMDTNDIRTDIREGAVSISPGPNFRGHFGTFANEVPRGMDEVVASRMPTATTAGAWNNFSVAGYRAQIDNNLPVVIWLSNGFDMAHAVVGYGYTTNAAGQLTRLNYRDPWDGTDKTVKTPQPFINFNINAL